jgi:hypothetical protein
VRLSVLESSMARPTIITEHSNASVALHASIIQVDHVTDFFIRNSLTADVK